MCKSICEAILALVIVVVALVQMQSPQPWALWVIVIAGLVSLVHSFACKTCFGGNSSPKASKKR
ncbi:hypothetical protein FJZ18_04070 [Candidatus Pacearchaeota archaeon]|nr:hypothetical protein [Candidatus Pacearchaeota archaeon]